MELVSQCALTVAVFRFAGWRPGFRATRADASDLLAFNVSTWAAWGLTARQQAAAATGPALAALSMAACVYGFVAWLGHSVPAVVWLLVAVPVGPCSIWPR